MKHALSSFRFSSARTGLVALSALTLVTSAQAGLFDGLFGKTAPAVATPEAGRREWALRDFTVVRLVPREAGAPPNEHPQAAQPEGLRQALAQLQVALAAGPEPLFGADELAELVGPLSQALAAARPDDDVLLLSTSRRGAGLFVAPTAITARLFVQGGALQVLVADARLDFYNNYLGTRQAPSFVHGSRARPGRAVLRTGWGSSPRPDWVTLPANATAAATVPPPPPVPIVGTPVAPPAPPMPTPAPAPSPAAAPAPPPAAAPALAPVAPVATTPARPNPAPAAGARGAPMSADEAETRLTTLKRLRERGLITEEEYQQKRREVLSQL